MTMDDNRREANRRYYLANRDKIIRTAREWDDRHPEEAAARKKRWRAAHRDQKAARKRTASQRVKDSGSHPSKE